MTPLIHSLSQFPEFRLCRFAALTVVSDKVSSNCGAQATCITWCERHGIEAIDLDGLTSYLRHVICRLTFLPLDIPPYY